MQRINLQSVSCMQLVTKVVRVARLHPITAIKRKLTWIDFFLEDTQSKVNILSRISFLTMG